MTISPRVMRTGLLIGEQGIQVLRQATVMIIGVGAVGGYALEAIARAGVGHIIVVDFDTFDETNINRQILALSSTIGRKKVDVARERIKEINPDCRIETKDLYVNQETLSDLLQTKADIVIDAIDSLNAKCCLIEELVRRDIPFISSMGAALKTDTNRIKIGTLDKTVNCSLSRMLRQRLRRRKVDIQKVKCVYSDEPAQQQAILLSDTEGKRNTLGSLPTITAIFGLTIANEVIKTLVKNGKQE